MRALTPLNAQRGYPGIIVGDNGTELTSSAVLAWCDQSGVEWHHIAPGKRMQNGYVEGCNQERPHTSLGHATPAAFAD